MTDRAADEYARQVGAEAAARQLRESRERHPCCGELVDEGHHQLCSKRPADEPAAHVDGQASLL